MDEFRKHREDKDTETADAEKKGHFCNPKVMPAVLSWLDDLATERCDVQIIRLLHTMFSIQPSHRPSADQVWKVLTTVSKTATPFSPIYFCGPCCMPLLHEDPLLQADAGIDLSQTKYSSPLPLNDSTPVSRDLEFKNSYDRAQQFDIYWKRNLRHWNFSILDVVQDGEHHYLLARKRVKSSGDDEGSCIAKNEAEILRQVKHRHIVTLHGTYRHGDLFTLLFKPAADHDLRSYLELTELYMIRKRKNSVDLDFLRRSFGCLANAVACVHKATYDHGDIRPENILVHDNRIYLSKFSFGLKQNIRTNDSGPSNQQLYRVMDLFGRLSLRSTSTAESQAQVVTGRQQRQQVRMSCSSCFQRRIQLTDNSKIDIYPLNGSPLGMGGPSGISLRLAVSSLRCTLCFVVSGSETSRNSEPMSRGKLHITVHLRKHWSGSPS